MEFLILKFFLSLLITLGLIRYKHLHEKISYDHDLSGPQKFHIFAVPRIGGIGIFLAITFTGVITFFFFKLDLGLLLVQLMACALPTFLIGLLEDITKRINVIWIVFQICILKNNIISCCNFKTLFYCKTFTSVIYEI